MSELREMMAAYRDPAMLREILERVSGYAGRPLAIMEVCGTHTMAVMRHGIHDALPPAIRLISGPGCPVCVTASSYLDMALALSERDDVVIATFGDLLRVPGHHGSLMECKARGADIRTVYSPLDCLAMCTEEPGKRFVFLSVGFETTTPVCALTVKKASERGIDNLSLLVANKTMPAAMEALTGDPELRIDGFLFPGHVCTIIGTTFFTDFCRRHGVAGAITGFEPADILGGILAVLRQVERGEGRAENLYPRVVRADGNPEARRVVDEFFAPCDAPWRGLGTIPGSGLCLRAAYARYNARVVFDVHEPPAREPAGCLCGEILRGKRRPTDCPLFGTACRPDAPIGACMVSSEGACAAYYRYAQHVP